MEKVKDMARPFTFPVFKVSKSSLEFVRFEAEIENYSSMENVLAKLDMRTIKLSGFTELLKIRAAESKTPFPTRADWDEFFRDNKDMNEMKAGERPDTLHLQNLPVKWFLQLQDKSGVVPDKPSEFVLKKAFSSFGDIRLVDIPMLDPYRNKMANTISGIKTFSFGEDLVFQAYVQFKEYIGFVKCMNALKGMKLCYKDRDSSKAWTANIKVDFDRSKHLAESTIKARKEERERLVKEEVDRMEKEKRNARLEHLQKKEQIKLLEAEEREQKEKKAAKSLVAEQRRLAREEKRKNRRLKKTGLTEEEEMAYRIGAEERKLILAQRKLESIRILDELISRAKGLGKIKPALQNKTPAVQESSSEDDEEKLKSREKEYRDKLVMKLKKKVEGDLDTQKTMIKRTRNEGFENVSDSESDNSRAGSKKKIKLHKLEKISDDELSDVGSDEDVESEIDSEEELRLTSTDDESEDDKRSRKRKKDKKDKKDKKEKKAKREKEDRKLRDERRKRELDKQIKMAERIAKKRSPDRDEKKADLWEHEKYDRLVLIFICSGKGLVEVVEGVQGIERGKEPLQDTTELGTLDKSLI
ncbi:A-kinase anchor protein 17A [Eurytemora carolleeae]|uniref:A-kinase anchor protein 17A n=1 Tax=Eurytemora carolleeae TaxID=1294199 RepID=UPI000C7733B6|nr:A-kinase anchor protein 17A [Eurytemora carolleeae]|eukprot:XP_023344762.1 A-kinase anchor protein 17A-like [Eurytemora affinis]